MRHFLGGYRGGGQRLGSCRLLLWRPRVGRLVGGRGRALQVVGVQVCVLSILRGWCQALVGGQGSVLTLETQRGGLQRLPTPGGRLLGLQQTLVPPLAAWSVMGPWKHKGEFSDSQRMKG